jgi:hypothetical protein
VDRVGVEDGECAGPGSLGGRREEGKVLGFHCQVDV